MGRISGGFVLDEVSQKDWVLAAPKACSFANPDIDSRSWENSVSSNVISSSSMNASTLVLLFLFLAACVLFFSRPTTSTEKQQHGTTTRKKKGSTKTKTKTKVVKKGNGVTEGETLEGMTLRRRRSLRR